MSQSTVLTISLITSFALFSVIISTPVVYAQSDLTVSTYAGTGEYGSTDGPAHIATFDNPDGLAFDAAGNLYVSDWDNNKIRIIYPNGTVSTYAGTGESGSTDGPAHTATFNGPSGLTFDAAGNLYVSDWDNNKIRIIYPNGTVSTYAGTGESGSTDGPAHTATFAKPIGLAFDTAGNLYVADIQKIRIIYHNGTVSTYAGTGESGSTDGSAHTVTSIHPAYLAFDTAGNLYVSDWGNNKIRIIYPNGTISTYAGTDKSGSTDGSTHTATFGGPSGLAFDTAGNLYIVDDADNKIRIIYSNGTVSTYAGTGEYGSTDGPAHTATFSSPAELVFDVYGNLYITDVDNPKIRKINSNLPTPPIPSLISTNTQGNIITITFNQDIILHSNTPTSEFTSSDPTISITNIATLDSDRLSLTLNTSIMSNQQLYLSYTSENTHITDTQNFTLPNFSLPIQNNVIDVTSPIITLLGDNPQIILLGDEYTELHATTNNNLPVTIDSSAVNTSLIGNYTVYYTSTDLANNTAIVIRTVIVQDIIPPVITINGDNPYKVELGSNYTEPNATTDDNSPVIIGGDTVNTSLVGNYTITYDSTDSAGNNAIQVNRTVIIQTTNSTINHTLPNLINSTDIVNTTTIIQTNNSTINHTLPNLTNSTDIVNTTTIIQTNNSTINHTLPNLTNSTDISNTTTIIQTNNSTINHTLPNLTNSTDIVNTTTIIQTNNSTINHTLPNLTNSTDIVNTTTIIQTNNSTINHTLPNLTNSTDISNTTTIIQTTNSTINHTLPNLTNSTDISNTTTIIQTTNSTINHTLPNLTNSTDISNTTTIIQTNNSTINHTLPNLTNSTDIVNTTTIIQTNNSTINHTLPNLTNSTDISNTTTIIQTNNSTINHTLPNLTNSTDIVNTTTIIQTNNSTINHTLPNLTNSTDIVNTTTIIQTNNSTINHTFSNLTNSTDISNTTTIIQTTNSTINHTLPNLTNSTDIVNTTTIIHVAPNSTAPIITLNGQSTNSKTWFYTH